MDRRAYEQMQALEDHHWWFLGRRAVIGAVLAGLPAAAAPRLVLDAGCGSGGNLDVYRDLGPVIGVDLEPGSLAQSLRRGYQAVGVASLPHLPFGDATFDLVAATDVVEHVADDAGALRELFRVTRPGGHLLITVPAYRWLWTESDLQLGHHRRYTRSVMARRCRAAGWTVARSTYFNTGLLPAIAAVRWVRQRQGRPMTTSELERTGPVANRVLRLPMETEARLVKAGLRLPAGVSLACLCRRPSLSGS